jgi:trk system potassium uptake protein TrkH
MNKRIIFFILGRLLLIESFFFILSAVVSLIYGEETYKDFLLTAAISISVGLLAWLTNSNTERTLGKKEGYIIVSLVWVVFSLFGALPFLISGAIPSYTDAFFETMSGFTTTGSSILSADQIDNFGYGLHFWRSITQWIGGMGIIVMAIAIFPLLGIGGMQLFVAEVPGPSKDKLHPRIKETAKRLWGIYILFTVLEAILLYFGGMSAFDAICHSFTTMATGGYSTHGASIAFFDSSYIYYVIAVFMFIAGTNFTLSYFLIQGKFKKIFYDEEFKFYILFALGFTVLITSFLVFLHGEEIAISFRDSLFQVVSILTTTGFTTADYTLWAPFIVVIIFILMFFGGSAGSTGGGMKIVRVALIIKNSYFELRRLIHPNAVIPVKFNKKSVFHNFSFF